MGKRSSRFRSICWWRLPVRSADRWLSREEYAALARGMRKSLFRLQIHPTYRVAAEEEEFKQFLATGTYEIDPNDAALTRARQRRADGKLAQRVYALSTPLTDYQRYVFKYYHQLALAGEDLRIIDSRTMPVPRLPDYDFMLLDDTTVIKVHYDADGTWVGPELLATEDVSEYLAYKQDAVAGSVPFLDFEERLGG
ncbi:DUF6879 family protein [Amycolatopsis sp. NPDC059021]|uniref:DUF6879 family protein n=1 Tax=Amycolatopsis sp. NPDC059021 TaxID=3346704 RepID=UPI00366D8025